MPIKLLLPTKKNIHFFFCYVLYNIYHFLGRQLPNDAVKNEQQGRVLLLLNKKTTYSISYPREIVPEF